jgi:protein O-mannosyl-transferase
MTTTFRPWLRWWLVVAIAVVAAASFLPALNNSFLAFDDDENFVENPWFRGLGWSQIRWAWTTFLLGVYQPLAWMMLELEYLLAGLDPRGYHLASIGLHAAVAVALFALIVAILRRCGWPASQGPRRESHLQLSAALAAILFAVHPLRVEVVAWASCQPYLPCALFSILTILAYLRTHDEPAAAQGGRRRAWMMVTLALFTAALLSKAVAVTLPFVILAIDDYLRRRFRARKDRRRRGAAILAEQLPFLALAILFMGLAILAKQSNESLISIEHYGMLERLVQSCYGVCFYLAKTFWPFDLVAFYPLPRRTAMMTWPYLGSVGAVLAITLAILALGRRWPGLVTAWIVYLAILAPNLGIVRISNQLAADRYCYVASMSLAAVLAHGMALVLPWVERRRWRVIAFALASCLLITGLSVLSWRQCRTWRTIGGLWRHVHDHGYSNDVTVLFNMGLNMSLEGDDKAAMEYYAQAIKSDPRNPDAHNLFGAALARRGRFDEAMREVAEAVRLDPRYAAAQNDLGSLLARQGRLPQAIGHFREAVQLKPDFPLARRNLARALLDQRRIKSAILELQEGVRLSPLDAMLRNDLGLAHAQAGELHPAIEQFAEASRLDPSLVSARINLGLALEQNGNFEQAIAQFAEAVRLEPAKAANHVLLASALARAGRTREAAEHYSAALRIDHNDREARAGLDQLRGQPRAQSTGESRGAGNEQDHEGH